VKQTILACSLFAAQMVFLPAFAAPAGSYTNSCRNIHIKARPGLEPTLIAECRNQGGKWIPAELIGYRSCKTIDNVNGRLACRK
jgi:hypothetical protein